MPRRCKSKHGHGTKKQVVLKKHPESESQEVVAHGKDNNNLSNEEGSTGGVAGSSSKPMMVDPTGTRATADELAAETTVSNAHLSDLLTLLFMARQENDQIEKELEEKENFLRNLKAMNKGLLEKSSSKKSKAKGKEAELGEVQLSAPSDDVTDTRGAGAGSSGVLVNPVSRSCRKAYRKNQGLKMAEAKKGKEIDDVGGARTLGGVVDEVVQSVTQELSGLAVEEDQQQPCESRPRSMTRRSPDITVGHKF